VGNEAQQSAQQKAKREKPKHITICVEPVEAVWAGHDSFGEFQSQ
jgi:hypothetical protein